MILLQKVPIDVQLLDLWRCDFVVRASFGCVGSKGQNHTQIDEVFHKEAHYKGCMLTLMLFLKDESLWTKGHYK
jgi:hypothetical protein